MELDCPLVGEALLMFSPNDLMVLSPMPLRKSDGAEERQFESQVEEGHYATTVSRDARPMTNWFIHIFTTHLYRRMLNGCLVVSALLIHYLGVESVDARADETVARR